MGRKKKYTYKHLTNEMKKTLDDLIKEKGKKEAYNAIYYNIFVNQIADAQNKPYAFDVIMRDKKGMPCYRYQGELLHTPIIWGSDDMPIEQEMLFYIDGKRFYDTLEKPFWR